MNGMARWTPARNLLHQRFDRLFDDLFTDSGLELRGESVDRGTWVPAVDIRETQDAVTLVAELPGLTKQDVQVNVENNVLSISGERRLAEAAEGESLRRVERSYGKFNRSFSLPSDVDRKAVTASFENGLLNIRLPRTEETKPRSIEIQ